MKSRSELERAVAAALEALSREGDVVEVEVFASANEQRIARLNYTSHIASNGVEEPKSTSAFGVGVQAAFRRNGQTVVGFGFETGDLSPAAALRALERARNGAVHDEEFDSFPSAPPDASALGQYHDPALMDLSDRDLVALGWDSIEAGLRAFHDSPALRERAGGSDLAELGLILGGDVTALAERMALASTHMPQPTSDENSLLLVALTAMVERYSAKGSGYFASAKLGEYRGQAAEEAADAAIRAMGGARIPSGEYTVVFGPQPTSDLIENIVLPSLRADCLYAATSAFLGRFNQRIAHESLSLYDDGRLAGAVATKAVTGEGLPTGRTDLIRDGRFVGALCDWYESKRIMRDAQAREKLGVDPRDVPHAFVPRNGFRFASGGGRSHESKPHICATNVVLEARDAVAPDELIRRVGTGVYVGRIWYTYPVNGLTPGDFTATIVADSFLIRDGRLAEPLAANAVRINDNINRILTHVTGASDAVRPVVVWAADEVVHAGDLAVTGVRLDAIDAPA